jgi:hypothetical protein
MGFKISTERLFTSKVTVQVPQGNNRYQPESFTLNFVAISREEADQLLQDNDREFFERVVRGWSHVNDENDQPLDFTPENLHKLVQIPYAFSAIVKTYFEEAFGGKAKRKN